MKKTEKILRKIDDLLYYSDMTAKTPKLLFEEVAPHSDFHAAMVLSHPRSPHETLHTHDFWEMMYVLEGSGTHWIGERPQALSSQALSSQALFAGDLLWIRPTDSHTICARGGRMHFVNVAFPAPLWQEFRSISGLEKAAAAWDSAEQIPTIAVSANQQDACAAQFERVLRAFQTKASRLDLCRFLSEVLPLLLPEREEENTALSNLPPWLRHICDVMINPANLREGVPRMVQLSAVSPAHLSRTLKQGCGQTPTQFVNALRLKRAAVLLRTTSQEITEIALDCGFENLSYFYRCFKETYGCPPLAYRLEARHRILGDNEH